MQRYLNNGKEKRFGDLRVMIYECRVTIYDLGVDNYEFKIMNEKLGIRE